MTTQTHPSVGNSKTEKGTRQKENIGTNHSNQEKHTEDENHDTNSMTNEYHIPTKEDP